MELVVLIALYLSRDELAEWITNIIANAIKRSKE
jgi:hypothetical protein